jgi:hypothetical protein
MNRSKSHKQIIATTKGPLVNLAHAAPSLNRPNPVQQMLSSLEAHPIIIPTTRVLKQANCECALAHHGTLLDETEEVERILESLVFAGL